MRLPSQTQFWHMRYRSEIEAKGSKASLRCNACECKKSFCWLDATNSSKTGAVLYPTAPFSPGRPFPSISQRGLWYRDCSFFHARRYNCFLHRALGDTWNPRWSARWYFQLQVAPPWKTIRKFSPWSWSPKFPQRNHEKIGGWVRVTPVTWQKPHETSISLPSGKLT